MIDFDGDEVEKMSDAPKRSLRRALTVGIAIATVVLGVLGVHAVATATNNDRSDPTPAPAAGNTEKVNDVVAELSGFRDDRGFAGFSLDDGAMTVTIHWAGDIPPAVDDTAGDHDGVQVKVRSALYSEADISKGLDALFKVAKDQELPVVAASGDPATFDYVPGPGTNR